MRTQTDVRVTIRVDRDIKEQADALFERLGLNMTTALNVFLRKAIAEEAIPFSVNTKKSELENEFATSDVTKAFEIAVQNETQSQKQNGFPVARYDSTSKRAYLEHTDGTREYVSR